MGRKTKVLVGLVFVAIVVGSYRLFDKQVNSVVLDLYSPKVIGAGDSIMSRGTELEDVASQLTSLTGSHWQFQNVAIGGGVVGREIVAGNIPPPNRFELPWRHKNIVWVLAGTNNIGYDHGSEHVEKLLAATENLFRELHAAGYKKDQCFFTDILRRDGGSEFEQDRTAFNSEIGKRLEDLAHVIPSGSNPSLQNPFDKTLFRDGVHPTFAGDKFLATDAVEIMQRVLDPMR